MKIIIDIPKEEYLKLIETDENGEKEIPLGLLMSLWDSVKYNCTPLPFGHEATCLVSEGNDIPHNWNIKDKFKKIYEESEEEE